MARVNCASLFDTLREKGIIDNNFNEVMRAMNITPKDIANNLDGFFLSYKNYNIEASKITRAKYFSNASANRMYDNLSYYTSQKNGELSRVGADQFLRSEFALTRKHANEQKSIFYGDNMFGKEFVDANGKNQMFASYIEDNNMHKEVFDILMNNKTTEGLDKNAADVLNQFRRHMEVETSGLVGTKPLDMQNMMRTEYIYGLLDEAKLDFYNSNQMTNQATRAKKSVLKFLRGDNHIEIKPNQKSAFFQKLREDFADVLDLEKASPERVDAFFDNYFFSRGGKGGVGGMLDYNLFDSMDKSRLFGDVFSDDFVRNPMEFTKYQVNAVDALDSLTKRWSRNYGIYRQLGPRPFETLKGFIDKAKANLDSTTFGNVKNLTDRKYVGGLMEELNLSSTASRNAALDVVNGVGNLVLAPRLLCFSLVNVDDIPMRSVLTSAMTGDSALKRAFFDSQDTLRKAVKDFVVGTATGKSTFEKNALNTLADQQQANLARILSGSSLDGMPRYTSRFQKFKSVFREAYESGGITKTFTAATGSNIGTLGNDSLEKAMVFNSNDIANEILTKIKSGELDYKKAFLTDDAIKRNGITPYMLEAYKKSDKVLNFADDLSNTDVLKTMKISPENINTRSLDKAIQGEVIARLDRKGIFQKGGNLTGTKLETANKQIADFYINKQGNVPDDILKLINKSDQFDIISTGGELTVRTKPEFRDKFSFQSEKLYEANINPAYRELIQRESQNLRKAIETEVISDLRAGKTNKIVEGYNKKIDKAIEIDSMPKDVKTSGPFYEELKRTNPEFIEIMNRNATDAAGIDAGMKELIMNQRSYLDESFENLQYTLFEDHFGLFSNPYDTANVLNDLAQLDTKLAIMYRLNTFYKATLGRSNNRMLKLMNAKLGDADSLSVDSAFRNRGLLINSQVADMFVAATIGNHVVNAFKSDLQGQESFLEVMTDPKKWANSAMTAPYVSSPLGFNYTTTLGTAVSSLTSAAKNKVTGENYYAAQDMEKFRKSIFSGTGYNIVDNWFLSNFMEITKPDPQLGDPLTEIYAYTSKKYRKESGYQKKLNSKTRKEQSKKKKESGGKK